MDTSAFSEGLPRLYAEFADSIRENDSESVRNAYKQLRNSGRPITEILNEAIRTVGVSHGELEKHLLGEHDSKPVKQNSVVPITTEASSVGFYVRLAAWAFVVGMTGFVLVSVVQILTISSASTSKLAATIKRFGATPTNGVDMPAAQKVEVPAAQKDVGSRVFSPAPLNSVTAVPSATGSDLKIDGAVTIPRAPAKPDAETTAAQPPIQGKAGAIGEDASKREASAKPITTPPAGPQRLTFSSDVAHRSVGVQNEVKPSEPPPSIAADATLDAPSGRASNQTKMALNPPALPPRGTPAKDTSLLLERGDSLFRIGDVASARGFYEKAAEKGNGQAALRLGESYDRSFLQQANLGSVRADTSAAVFWYQRAWVLGVAEAEILLKAAEGE